MQSYLIMMAVRLLEMKRLLKDTGSLYLHIDHTAYAYVKALLDGIFGKENFRNEIVWSYQTGGVSKRWFGRKHDAILFYSKTEQYFIDLLRVKEPRTTEVLRRLATGKESATRAPDEERLPFDVWSIQALNAMSNERSGFPTQKPLALYERIIKASSNPGDWVLDPFCGCATTPIAAEKLGRKWVGMDIWDGDHEVVLKRMEDNRQLLTEPNPQIHYTTIPPVRTDDGEEAVVYLPTLTGRRAQRYPPPPLPAWEAADRHWAVLPGLRAQLRL